MMSPLLLSCLLASAGPALSTGARGEPASEKTIRALFAAGSAAWNRGEMDAYLAGYWDSPQTRWVSGATVLRGRDAISPAFRSRFPSPQEMGKFETSELEIDLLTDNDALVFAHGFTL